MTSVDWDGITRVARQAHFPRKSDQPEGLEAQPDGFRFNHQGRDWVSAGDFSCYFLGDDGRWHNSHAVDPRVSGSHAVVVEGVRHMQRDGLMFRWERTVPDGWVPAEIDTPDLMSTLELDDTSLWLWSEGIWYTFPYSTLWPDDVSLRSSRYAQELLTRRLKIDIDIESANLLQAKAARAQLSLSLVTSSSEMTDRVPAPDIVEKMLVHGTFALHYGLSGSMKSFVALDLSHHVALGSPWCDRHALRCPVLYVAERSDRIMVRQRAWLEHYGITDPPELLFWWERGLNLLDHNSVGRVVDACKDLRSPLVVIDTLNRHMHGGSELSDESMNRVVAAVDRMRAVGSTVWMIHHTTQDGGRPRGYSNLEAAADSWFLSKKIKGSSRSTFKCVKQNDGPENWEIGFQWRANEDTGSGIVVPQRTGMSRVVLDAGEGTALSILDSLDTADAKTWRAESALNGSRFKSAREGLESKRLVEKDAEGSYEITADGRRYLDGGGSSGVTSRS